MTKAGHVLMLTTASDHDEARRLAEMLVEQRLGACVQFVPVDSVYRWEGEVESAAEVLLLIKTRAALIEPVTVAVKAAHSYATPEIIAVPITSGLPAYLSWIDSVTG